MRINDTKLGFYSYQNQQKNSNISNTSKKVSNSAEVKISSRGREISEALQSEQTQRHQRIQELKQQIADGTYHVDSSKIADKMLDFWKDNTK
ncbi:flagellar biosynthesis anti-sigma factor FlgM [Neobacillus citreus]|uniref:Negative regulator of flagellin synthesis n=1 Tax=Neobacillus citreus TaxID=2833578 RepID=A0A942Y630_9BACI|nr:flagellar biosynthesis anti-sigma factor FlgM [Neobacillus citreus]MCH6266836.1 flagellar biosynthesis anti-sigma factor FlgM [Neobacillus citreus]